MTPPSPKVPRPAGPRPSIRLGTRRVVRPSGPPTTEIPIWTDPDGIDTDQARAVIDLALRVCVAFMATGAAARDVVTTALRLTRAYGLRSVNVDVTYTAMTLSYHRGPHADPITVVRVVRSRSQDFARLERLRHFVDQVAADPPPVEAAREACTAIVRAPHPYRRWIVTTATGVLGAAVALLLGASPPIILIAFLTTAAIDRLQSWLGRASVAPFFSQALAAAVPTAVAVLVTALASGTGLLLEMTPSLIIAAGIVVLLAGMSVVGAAQDAIEGFYVTAGARAFEVVVLTLGIVVGITVVLALAHRFGVIVSTTADSADVASPAVAVGAAILIAAAFAFATYAVGQAVVVAALSGGLCYALYLLMSATGAGRPTASAVAAFLIGFPAQLVARRLAISALVVITAAIVPLVPGRVVYQGVFELVSLPQGVGLTTAMGSLASAAGIGMGIAAGVSLGTYLARLLLSVNRARRPRDPSAEPGR